MPKSELLAQQSFQPSCLVLTELLWTGLECNPWSADYGIRHLIAPLLNHQTWAALGKVLLGMTNVFKSNRLTNSSLNLCMQPATTLLTTSIPLNTCTQLNTCIPLTTFHWPHLLATTGKDSWPSETSYNRSYWCYHGVTTGKESWPSETGYNGSYWCYHEVTTGLALWWSETD